MTEKIQTAEIQVAPKTGLGSALIPKTFEEALRFCDVLCKSTLVPADYQGKPANVLVALQYGMELGISPLQAMRSIAVVDGRPMVYGDMVLGLIRSSGLLASIQEEIRTDAAGDVAVCTVVRVGDPRPVVRTFSEADAKRAGLTDKVNWKKYPKRMLQARARSYALRDVFPDVLNGLFIRDEFGPVVEDLESTPVAVNQASQPVIDVEVVAQSEPSADLSREQLFVKSLEDSQTREDLDMAAKAIVAAGVKSIDITKAYQRKDRELKAKGL